MRRGAIGEGGYCCSPDCDVGPVGPGQKLSTATSGRFGCLCTQDFDCLMIRTFGGCLISLRPWVDYLRNIPGLRFCYCVPPLPSGELQGSALVRLSLQTLATFDWGDINLLEFMRDYIMG